MIRVKRADGSSETIYEGHHVTLCGGLQEIADLSLRFAPEKTAREQMICAEFKAGEGTLAVCPLMLNNLRNPAVAACTTELSNKLVEDTLFWEEAKLDLRKIQ